MIRLFLASVWVLASTLSLSTGSLSAAPTVEKDVPYVADPHPEQHLDFHWPQGEEVPATVLFLHGGGMDEAGERRESPMYAPICPAFVEAGLGCATADYRLFPSFAWPAMPEDVAAAIVEVRELVEKRGGVPDRLFLFGHSSGCHLAAVVGTNPVYLQAVGLEPASLAGLVLMGCTLDKYDAALREENEKQIAAVFERHPEDSETRLYGTAEQWIAGNPAHHLGPHVPPTLVVVAHEERFFPSILEQGARFVRLLLEADVPADLVLVPGRHFASIEALSNPGDSTMGAILDFLDRQLPAADFDPRAGDRKTILDASRAFSRAYVAGDSAAVAELYTEDALLMPPGRDVRGRAAIARFFSTPPDRRPAAHWMESSEVSFHGDVAIDVGRWSLQSEEDAEVVSERYLLVWLRQADGSWRIAYDAWHRPSG